MDNVLLEHLLRIRQEIGSVNQAQADLSTQMTAIAQRLSQVERCLVNLHHDVSQSRTRAIWTDEERTAFSTWLAGNDVSDDGFPKLPS